MSKLSVKRRKELEVLAHRPDDEIDLSDIPENSGDTIGRRDRQVLSTQEGQGNDST